MDTLRDIIINIILLFGLVFMISLSSSTIKFKKKWMDILFGFVIGLVTMIIMMNAWQMDTGAIFDTRSVMIGVTSLFFSYTTSFIAAIIAIAYRVYVGGLGVYAGVLSILSALLIGWIWKRYIYEKLKINKYLNLYLFGFVIHIFVILSQFSFPYPQNIEVIKNVGLIFIVFFPIATTLLSMAVLNHENRIKSQQMIINNEKKYRTLINNSKLGVIQYNNLGVIEIANDAFAKILSASTNDLIGLNMFDLPDKRLVSKIKSSLDGNLSVYEGYYKSFISNKTFPTRSQFSPIYENDHVIGGIGIIEDLTKEYEDKQKISELTLYDSLTKLYNRQSFDTYILSNPLSAELPISIITLDINSFHIINTSFGYEVGNQVLVKIAKTMKNTLKNHSNPYLYRIGGDEFACVINKTSIEEAEMIGKLIKDNVSEIEAFNFNINMSYGVYTTDSLDQSLSETYNQALINMNSNKIYDGSSISTKTIELIMGTLFDKSKREKMHSERVSLIAKNIAQQFNLGTAFVNRVELAGRLHDIGKINISEEILDKPGKLNDYEWKKIIKHPESGFRILSTVPEYLDIANIVLTHHERFDGKGYPKGLSGHNIPLESRIISLADAYDAMTEQRTYRMVLSEEEAIQEIKYHKGTQFDPEVVDKFLIYVSQLQ